MILIVFSAACSERRGAGTGTGTGTGTGSRSDAPSPLSFFPALRRPRVQAPLAIRPRRGPVIILLIDALSARHLSTYGYGRPTAPAIDRVAAEGITFAHAVAASCWTRPTVASLMTGKPQREHRVEEIHAKLDASYTTLAEAFRAGGWRTAAFVGNPIVRSSYGYDQGFERYLDSDDLGAVTPANAILDHALGWVREHRTEDFLLWVFLTDAHDPYVAPPTHRGAFDEGEAGEYPPQPPPEVAAPFEPVVQRRIAAAYDAQIRFASDSIGRFLDALGEMGVRDRATILVSADHGEMVGEHRAYRHLFHFWEPVLRIPLVLRSPAIEARGLVEPRLVTQVDLMPTLLELHGLPVPEGVRGRSLLPMLRDPSAPGAPLAISEMGLFGVRRQAVRDERRKVIVTHPLDEQRLRAITGHGPERLPSLPRDSVRRELYDLWTDPEEAHDLAASGSMPPEGQRLLDAAGDAAPALPPAEVDQRLLEELRALGYAQ